MTEPDDVSTEPAATLPKEEERRVVEDADARGIAVVLQGGETWYVQPLPLSPRGLKIGALIDQLETLEVDAQSAGRGEAVAEGRLLKAEEDADIEAATKRLHGARERRAKVMQNLKVQHRELAYHALRSHYRLTRDEVGILVTQRHWPDIVAALHGKDTEGTQRELALDLFARLAAATSKAKESADPGPLASATASAGAAVS